MKALVLGSTGFLGANLIRALLEKRYDIRAFHRPTSSTLGIDGLPGETALGDFNDRDSLLKAMQGCEVVFHAGAYYPNGPVPVKKAIERGVTQLRSVMEAALHAGVHRLIYGSSLTTIGPPSSGDLADERCPFQTPYVDNPYLMSKAAMEEEVRRYVKERGLPAVIGIPTVLVGPYDVKPSSGKQILLIARRRLPFYIEGKTNVVDVRDAARGMVLLMERGRIGERYILGGVNTTQREFNREVAAAAGVLPPLLPLPFALSRWGSKGGDFLFSTLFRHDPPVPSFFVEVLREIRHYDITKARTEIGYQPGPIEPAIRDALQWFRTHHYYRSAAVQKAA